MDITAETTVSFFGMLFFSKFSELSELSRNVFGSFGREKLPGKLHRIGLTAMDVQKLDNNKQQA